MEISAADNIAAAVAKELPYGTITVTAAGTAATFEIKGASAPTVAPTAGTPVPGAPAQMNESQTVCPVASDWATR